MGENRKDQLLGTLDLLVLRTLATGGRMHGYSISERVEYIVETQRLSLAKPTQTQREAYRIAGEEFSQELAKLRALIDGDLKGLEKALDTAGAPYTPGRLPEWKEK